MEGRETTASHRIAELQYTVELLVILLQSVLRQIVTWCPTTRAYFIEIIVLVRFPSEYVEAAPYS